MFLPAACFPASPGGPRLDAIKLPKGFVVEMYTDKVKGARSMTLGEKRTLFVGTREEGKVYAVTDTNGDGKADEVIIIAEGLNEPNGVAFSNGSLYVAEATRVIRYDGIEGNLRNASKPVIVNDRFPKAKQHEWKFIAFGPDHLLYVPVGAPCNVCNPEDPRFASIMRMKPDGSNLEIFAKGVRNTVGFDWRPTSRELWFTDNGADWMGPDRPPDELNRAPKKGMDFGFPFCHGGSIPDPGYGREGICEKYTPPAITLGPHVAALGMRFYTGSVFPKEYRNAIFIAEHGSWNRPEPIGYRVTTVMLEGDKAVRYDVFAEGWLSGANAWGRPVDVMVMPDGSLLVSDDRQGAIYRISYRGESTGKQQR